MVPLSLSGTCSTNGEMCTLHVLADDIINYSSYYDTAKMCSINMNSKQKNIISFLFVYENMCS